MRVASLTVKGMVEGNGRKQSTCAVLRAKYPCNQEGQDAEEVQIAQVVQWAPQNDVLGHSKMRAFLTHGGVNGLYEVRIQSLSQPLMHILLEHKICRS